MTGSRDPYSERLITEAGWSPSDSRLVGRPLRELRAECDRLDVDEAALARALDGPYGALRASLVAWDTETWRIAPGRVAPPLVCVSLAWRASGGVMRTALLDRATGVEVLRRLLRAEDGPQLVAHNQAFDAAVAWAAAADLRRDVWRALDDGRLRCTRIREKLLQVARGEANRASPPSSLASCVKRYLAEYVEGKAGEDTWRLRYHELDGIPIADWPVEARRYASLDAVYCYRVFEAQLREIEELECDSLEGEPGGILRPVPDEAPRTRAAFGLAVQAMWGLRADPGRVETYESELEARVERARPVLEAAGLLVNGTMSQLPQKQAVVDAYARHGLGDPPLTKTGRKRVKDGLEAGVKYVSLEGDVLRDVPCSDGECSDDGPCGELLHVVADRQDAHRETRFAKILRQAAKEVVNPRVSELLATGRASISGLPYQQFPRAPGARECIVPRRGYVLVGADLDSAESVSFAQVLLEAVGYSVLADELNAGRDPHLTTAAMLLGIDYAEAEQRKAAKDLEVKAYRQLAKPLDFGLPVNMGAATFVGYAWKGWRVRLSVEEATRYKRQWLDLYPEVREYHSLVGSRVDSGGGRFDYEQPYSGRLRGGVGYRDGCNTSFQGLVADAVLAALYRVQRECWVDVLTGVGPVVDSTSSTPLFGCRGGLFVHDEIVVEAPEQTAPEAAERLATIMVEELCERCPGVAAACAAEPWIARRWSKSVETLRDEQGRLLPWDDE
jgi:hypothetical protein